jgi:cysteine desulfurase/selenocysteine lyase
VLIDGAQAVPQMPVDVGAIGADFYAWTGHKALGPTGVGVLHATPRCSRRCRRSSPAAT